MRRDGAFIRRQRIEEVWRYLLELKNRFGRSLPRKRTFALLQIKTGLKPERLEEYLQIRVDAGLINLTMDFIHFDEEMIALMETARK